MCVCLMYVCAFVNVCYMYTHTHVLFKEARRECPGARDTGRCELFDMGAGN